MSLFPLIKLIVTEPAIETGDALKALGLMGIAAIAGPLVIGGLFFILKKRSES